MRIIRQLPEIAKQASAVAIGNFDGLHKGHQCVIGAMVEAAHRHGAVPSVLTFEPHPRKYFKPDSPPFRLQRLRDKLAGLQALGVEQVVMPRFNAAFATISAQAFLDEVLGKQLNAKAVVTGENFVFGHRRGGDSAMLNAWGKLHNIEIVTIKPVMQDAIICSSSNLREAIAKGDVAMAAKLLGGAYTLAGRVVHGEKRGRQIGFPTANIALAPGLLLPAFGVYAVRANVEGVMVDGVANLGIRPTVAQNSHPSFEVHLFDTMQEIYGLRMRVMLVDKIRDEMKFDGLDALKHQIASDCAMAKALLGRQA